MRPAGGARNGLSATARETSLQPTLPPPTDRTGQPVAQDPLCVVGVVVLDRVDHGIDDRGVLVFRIDVHDPVCVVEEDLDVPPRYRWCSHRPTVAPPA